VNARELAFVAAIALGQSGTQAAVVAGYPVRSAAQAASRLRKRPDIVAAIEKLKGRSSAATSPLQYLLGVVNDEFASTPRRIRAAIAAARYIHPRPSAGMKAQAKEAARTASAGKFGSAAAPLHLVPKGPRKS